MVEKLAYCLISIAIIIASLLSVISVNPPIALNPTILDLSWPNCWYTPKFTYQWGIVGVNGGLDFKANNCLSRQISYFSHYALYINTGYAGNSYAEKFKNAPLKCSSSESQCLAYNWGYNATKYALNYALLNGAVSNQWWLDVETANSWSSNVNVNRYDIAGATYAISSSYHLHNVQIGVYSTAYQWQQIVGNWQDGLPAWIGTGSTKLSDAKNACSEASFTGGPVLMTQFTPYFDEDVSCSPVQTQYISSSFNSYLY